MFRFGNKQRFYLSLFCSMFQTLFYNAGGHPQHRFALRQETIDGFGVFVVRKGTCMQSFLFDCFSIIF